MSSIYQCFKIDTRYTPPLQRLVYESQTEKEAISWLEANGGGIYQNVLHNVTVNVKEK
jgi:hypothetical protein